jgi:hypothetical protein
MPESQPVEGGASQLLLLTEINKARKEKTWKYVLIPHDKIDTNMTFKKLVTEFVK